MADIIHNIAEGFERSCRDCLDINQGVVLNAVKEQLMCGVDSQDRHLTPTYDNDPFFEEEGYWHHRNAAYKQWKRIITPPTRGAVLGLEPRPDEVPNLFIDGTFYSEITTMMQGDVLVTGPGSGNGPAIIRKYGDGILGMGPSARSYFNEAYMLPSIEKFFKDCGYR